jgi:hypothetical protein
MYALSQDSTEQLKTLRGTAPTPMSNDWCAKFLCVFESVFCRVGLLFWSLPEMDSWQWSSGSESMEHPLEKQDEART